MGPEALIIAAAVRAGFTVVYGIAAGLRPHQSELQEFGAMNRGKIVIRNQRQHGFAGWCLVNREAFQVVDFKAQVRLEQDRTNPA